jgi:sarcosine oxidase subunit alpha
LRELVFHAPAATAWLVVTRDTRTHAISRVEARAREAPGTPADARQDGARASLAQPFRLERRRPDRSRQRAALPLRHGRELIGHSGDTLASALLANGVRLVGPQLQVSSPARHSHCRLGEPNALVELRSGARREPNTRATPSSCTTAWRRQPEPLAVARVRPDGGQRAVRAAARAGFYYKTFMWPAAFWEKVYEPLIRRAAGLGRASRLPTPITTSRPTPSATCW